MVPTMAFVALTVGAVFVLRRPQAQAARLATPGFPVSPLLFLVPIVAILIVMRIVRDPLRTSIGFFILLLGVPVSSLGRLATTPGRIGVRLIATSSTFLRFFLRSTFGTNS